jgi:hypothetical protein
MVEGVGVDGSAGEGEGLHARSMGSSKGYAPPDREAMKTVMMAMTLLMLSGVRYLTSLGPGE